jgi:hypothetical protein
MKYFLLLSFILGARVSLAQTGTYVYKSREDYDNHRMDTLNDFIDYKKNTYTFSSSKGDVSYKWKDIWGFTYQGKTYKCYSGVPNDMCMLLDSGKICLWDNGKGFFELVYSKFKMGNPYEDRFYYLSTGAGETAPVLVYYKENVAETDSYHHFKRVHPELKEFYECMGSFKNRTDPNTVESCVHDYNASHR